MRIFMALLVVLIVAIILAGWFFGSGVYNIAATHPHSDFARWVFTTVRDQSIDRHSGGKEAPDLNDAALIRDGAHHYEETCVVCHGAPGEKVSEFAKGLNPSPPDLHDGKIQKKYSDEELYWIVEHGIRMTGMPAFGPTHDPKDLWAMIAFLRRLPEMKADDYKTMTQASEERVAQQHGER